MTPEQWQHIKQAFQAALDLPPSARQAYVARVADGDARAREQIELLLRAHGEAESFIEEPALVDNPLLAYAPAPTTQPMREDEAPSSERRIGAYRLVRELGRGGMGAVYLAERADGEFRKHVALKLIKRGMDTDFVLRRFRNERQILAALDHPHIARLLGGGTTDDGLPYFLMEYVAGASLHDYCDRERLTIAARLELFRSVCDAVAHAHANGVVHRDIKPGNILVTPAGEPKLLDFGIAKLLNPDLAAQTLDPTLTALRLMTPEYASPEQVCGGEITPSTDVYSLGVVLYELLSGHRPYSFRNRAPHEFSRVVCDEDPLPPSEALGRHEAHTLLPNQAGQETTLERVCEARRATAEELQQALAGDLDRIALKALRKAPVERYATVEELSHDIARHLAGEPVSASFEIADAAAVTEIAPPAVPRRRAGEAGRERALAVLPFKLLDPTGDTGDDYLGIGLTDALITRLGSLRRFAVRPTSSVLRFQDGDALDPVAAGRELGVQLLLDGRIRRVGGRIRVRVQLLDIREGATRWAGQFDEDYTDVLSLEDQISAHVAEALVPHLSGDERARLAKRGTDDPEAFEAYLRGRYHWSTFTEEGFAKAITCYYRAIAIDPGYALAYAGVADYHNWLGVYGVLPTNESFAAAREAATQAIRLDDTLAEAYTALGFALIGCGYRWREAEQQHLHALELNPSCAPAHAWYSLQLAMEGRFDEAIEHAERAVELDPLAPFNRYNLGWLLYHARRYDESLEVQRALIADEPNYGIAHFGLGWALARTGRRAEALASLRRAQELMPGITFVSAALAVVQAESGDADAARRLLAELRETARQRFVTPYHIALVHVALGERDEAFACLAETYENGDAWVVWLGVEPVFDSLRDDPRYAELLVRTKNYSEVRAPAAGTPVPDAPPTTNNEAYQLYVAGRYYSTRRSAEGMRQAIVLFERAVELDPSFALAYAELADCYALLNWYVEPPPPDAFEKAQAAALRAIEVDERLADAHASLGLIKLHYERDWDGAEREFLRAIELKPDNPVAHRWYAFTLSAMKRHDEAVAEIRRAQQIAPRSPVIATAVANVLFLARRYDEALAQCHQALELDAGSVAAHVVQRWAYEAQGLKEQARAAFEQERIFAGETPTTRAKQAHVLAACGQRDEARERLRELLARREEHWVTSYEIAVIYALLDEKDEAFHWLAQAEREHAVGFTFAGVDPHLDHLRGDPRFEEMLRRANMLPRPARVEKARDTGGAAAAATKIAAPRAKTGAKESGAPSAAAAATNLVPTPPRTEIAAAHSAAPDTAPTLGPLPRRRRTWWAAASIAALVFAAAVATVLLLRRPETQPAAAFQAGPMVKLTTTGNAVSAALSLDGNYVAYAIEEAERQSLWVRQTAVANSVRVVAPATVDYRGLTFAPDGAHIYYVAAAKDGKSRPTLYKVPALGGTALRLREQVDSPVALAPGGKSVAFVRRDAEQGRDVLLIADESGGAEREIAARQFPEHISTAHAPAWSPDGTTLAFAVEQGDARGPHAQAFAVTINDRHETALSTHRWLSVGQMNWLPGGDEILIAAQEDQSSFVHLWRLPRGGEARRLTEDLADYRGVSLAADGSKLVTVRREMLTSVWLAPAADPNRFTQITTGAGRYFDCSWTPDGKIIYASDAASSADIWEMEADGTGLRQLTAGAGRNYGPVVSPDNQHIVFHSDRSGTWQLWRMTRDGGDATQLTADGENSNWAQITGDNRRVIYEHTGAGSPVTLWSMPLAGGAATRLTRGLALRPALSPDNSSVAYWHLGSEPNAPWRIAIQSLGAEEPSQFIDVQQGVANGATQLRWARDGRALMYLDYRDGTTTLWRQPLDGAARVKMLESPGNMLLHAFDIDAKGRLVLSRGLMVRDVVLINNAAARPR